MTHKWASTCSWMVTAGLSGVGGWRQGGLESRTQLFWEPVISTSAVFPKCPLPPAFTAPGILQ